MLARARDIVGASRKETKRVLDNWHNRPHADLNLEETIDNIADKLHPEATDLLVNVKQQKRFDCVLMADTSLSMSGRKLALLAVAAAALAYKLPPEDFAIVVFESTATTIKAMRQAMRLEEVVTRILEVPASGYTNISHGLEEGLGQLRRGSHRRQCGILLSDGKYTAGRNPVSAAGRYSNLHIILLGDFNTDPHACYEMTAAAGEGSVSKIAALDSLPRELLRLLSRLLA